MATGISENPFLYIPRWAALNPPGIDAATKYLLEERDRELEDYLGTLSTGGGGDLLSISLSGAAHNVLVDTFIIDFETTDWDSAGAVATTFSGKGAIEIVTPGKWHVNTHSLVSTNSDGVMTPHLEIDRSGPWRRFDGTDVPGDGSSCFFNFDALFQLEAGDVIYSWYEFNGGIAAATTLQGGTFKPCQLQAFMIGT